MKSRKLSDLCTSHLKPPDPPPLGHERGEAGIFTSYSLHFSLLVGGEYSRIHGLCLPYRVIVSPWSAVCIFAPYSNLHTLTSIEVKARRHKGIHALYKMLCKVCFRHGMKKAVVAENLESLVKKGRHIFNEIVLINISNSARLDLSMTYFRGTQREIIQ